jgi:hypothetical protein
MLPWKVRLILRPDYVGLSPRPQEARTGILGIAFRMKPNAQRED